MESRLDQSMADYLVATRYGRRILDFQTCFFECLKLENFVTIVSLEFHVRHDRVEKDSPHYFVESLEEISSRLKLSEDVAGMHLRLNYVLCECNGHSTSSTRKTMLA